MLLIHTKKHPDQWEISTKVGVPEKKYGEGRKYDVPTDQLYAVRSSFKRKVQARYSAALGRKTVKVVPRPVWESSSMRPP
jgi:hypothetical protein